MQVFMVKIALLIVSFVALGMGGYALLNFLSKHGQEARARAEAQVKQSGVAEWPAARVVGIAPYSQGFETYSRIVLEEQGGTRRLVFDKPLSGEFVLGDLVTVRVLPETFGDSENIDRDIGCGIELQRVVQRVTP